MNAEDQQRQERDFLARLANLAVDAAVFDVYDAYSRATGSERTRFIIEAAIGYLLGEGLVQLTDGAMERGTYAIQVPVLLVPDAPAPPPRLRS